jgi:hypothetical protein
MIRQVYEIGMRVTWISKKQERASIGTIQIHDAGIYRLFTTDTFHLCYKILTTKSIDGSHQIESVVQMPDEWVPFQIYSTEEYPLYSITPALEFGSWSLQHEEDSQLFSEPPLPQQQRPTSRQFSPRQPQPYVRQVQPSSPSHQKSSQHHSRQRQPALRNKDRIAREQKAAPSSNSTSHVQHQSQHQLPKAPQSEQSVLSGQTSLQSQWIPLEKLSLSPSSQSSPRQRAKPQQQGHVSEHHSTASANLHGQTTSHQQKSRHPHQRHVPESREENSFQQLKN